MKNKLLMPIIALAIVTLISAIFFTQNPGDFISRISLFEDLYKNGSMSITAKNSINLVKIDGKEFGETPLELEDLSEGSHQIELIRKSENLTSDFYEPIIFYVDLKSDTEAIIDIEIGPNGSSSGYALYYTPSPNNRPKKGYLALSSTPVGSTFTVNGNKIVEGEVEIVELEAKEYSIEISAKGYESITIPIIIREGFNLNLDARLMPVPIELNEGETN